MLPISGDININAFRYIPKNYPTTLNTIGDHIKKKRLDLRLSKVSLAKIINVTAMSIHFWESGKKEPLPFYYKKIIDFLGYVPRLQAINMDSLSGKLFMYRMERGINQDDVARKLKIDQWAISKIEQEKEVLSKYMEAVINLLNEEENFVE